MPGSKQISIQEDATRPPASPAPLLWAVIPPSFQPWGTLGPDQNALQELFLLKLSILWLCNPSEREGAPHSLFESSSTFS